jgi:hypothetical protein
MVSVSECRIRIYNGKSVVADLVSFGSGGNVVAEFVGGDSADKTERKFPPFRRGLVKEPSLPIRLQR